MILINNYYFESLFSWSSAGNVLAWLLCWSIHVKKTVAFWCKIAILSMVIVTVWRLWSGLCFQWVSNVRLLVQESSKIILKHCLTFISPKHRWGSVLSWRICAQVDCHIGLSPLEAWRISAAETQLNLSLEFPSAAQFLSKSQLRVCLQHRARKFS